MPYFENSWRLVFSHNSCFFFLCGQVVQMGITMIKRKVKWTISDGNWHCNSSYSQDWTNKSTINGILWDQQTTCNAEKDGLFHIAVKDCFSRKWRKIFCVFSYYMERCLFKGVPSTHCAIVWSLRQLLQITPYRCLQEEKDESSS